MSAIGWDVVLTGAVDVDIDIDVDVDDMDADDEWRFKG
jgi:hypothetical protein